MSDLVSSSSVDVAAVMASLSDVGKAVAPAQYVKAARYIPEYASIDMFCDAVDPFGDWGSLPVPEDITTALAHLLRLESDTCRSDPQIQALLRAVVNQHQGGHQLLREHGETHRCGLPRRPDGSVEYDPERLFHWLTRPEIRRGDELKKADRDMPLPPYDYNKGFCESDVAAYPYHLRADTWGKKALLSAEDLEDERAHDRALLTVSEKSAIDKEVKKPIEEVQFEQRRSRSPNEGGRSSPLAGRQSPTRSRRYGSDVSVHAAGGLTWMQKALTGPSSHETEAEYIMFKESLSRAQAHWEATDARANAASYGSLSPTRRQPNQMETFRAAALEARSEMRLLEASAPTTSAIAA